MSVEPFEDDETLAALADTLDLVAAEVAELLTPEEKRIRRLVVEMMVGLEIMLEAAAGD